MNLINLFLGLGSACCFMSPGNEILIGVMPSVDGGAIRMGSNGEGFVSYQRHEDRSDLKVEKCGPNFNFYKYAADGSALYLKQGEVYPFMSKDILVLVRTPDDVFHPISITDKVTDKEFIKIIEGAYPSVNFYSFYIHTDDTDQNLAEPRRFPFCNPAALLPLFAFLLLIIATFLK